MEQIPVIPNGSPSIAPMVTGVTWMLISLATVFLALRLWCRVNSPSGLWRDDFILTASWVFLLLCGAFITAMFRAGFAAVAVPEGHPVTLRCAASSTSAIATVLSKVAFAATLLRLVDRTSGWRRPFLWFAIASMVATMAVAAVVIWARPCGAAAGLVPDRHLPGCVSADVLLGVTLAATAYSGIFDVVLAFLPWRIVWKLALKKHEKVALSTAMSLGVLAGVIVILRVRELALFLENKVPPTEISHHESLLALYLAAEPSITTIAQAIPLLHGLLRSFHRRRRSKGTSGNSATLVDREGKGRGGAAV